jgi:hypothetical protein
MTSEYMDAQKVGDMPLDPNLVDEFVKYVEGLNLPKTHDLPGDEPSDSPYDGVGNPYFNKYVIYDDIFVRFFSNEEDYNFFLEQVIHTVKFPPAENKKDEFMIKHIVGTIHSFFTAYYKRFFILRVSITLTEPESFMHYHLDLAGENADRFLCDISHPDNKMFGIEVENRLYGPLERLGVYKLDTTRQHRAACYSPKHKKISFIIQCIPDLQNYFEYKRKHLEVFNEVRSKHFSENPEMMNTLE